MLNLKQELELLKKAQNDNCSFSREELVVANIRLVISIAKKYRGQGLEFLDLIQEGYMGLNKSISNYQGIKEVRFSTYATLYIKRAIIRAIDEKARMIRIPVNRSEEIRKLKMMRNSFLKRKGYEPTLVELSERLNYPISKIKYIDELPQTTSIEEMEVKKRVNNLSINEKTVENEVIFNILREELAAAFAKLNNKEKQILILKYGLFDDVCHSRRQLAKKLKTSRQTLRKVEEGALSKLRKALT